MFDAGCSMLGRKITECMVSGVGCQGWAARYKIKDKWYRVQGIRVKAQGIRHKAQGKMRAIRSNLTVSISPDT